MKNLHLIPTDKPSMLYLHSNGELQLRVELSRKDGYLGNNQHIYITSDEEIKEGDWGFDGLHIFKCLKPFIANETTSGKNIPCFYIELDGKSNTFHETSYIKKIILTTDQDLIKDGVQPISNEFLEWFVKNTSCEQVEVDYDLIITQDKPLIQHQGSKPIVVPHRIGYKIIIPKDEPKQIKCYCGHTTMCDCGPLEEPKQGLNLPLLEQKLDEALSNETEESLNTWLKKETLEEAAEKLVLEYQLGNTGKIDIEDAKEMLIEFAKWQQKRRYSEEEVLEIVSNCDGSISQAKKGFEQFKKK